MIQILSVTDAQARAEICRRGGVKDGEDLHIIASVQENGVPENAAIFRYFADRGEILFLEENKDTDITVGLGKAVLSIMELRGVKNAVMPINMEKIARLLGFEEKDGKFSVCLEGYFCCKHHN